MSRIPEHNIPRGLEVADCDTCQRDPHDVIEDTAWREHRRIHGIVDRRRAQYRASKRRGLLREWRDEIGLRPVGALHDLGCDGNHYKVRRGCRPIAVFSPPKMRAVG